jgi:biotin operon repressor
MSHPSGFDVTDFSGMGAVDKLVWFFLRDLGPSRTSTSEIQSKLGLSRKATHTAFSKLRSRGLVLELEAPAGRRAGVYEAVTLTKEEKTE